MTSCDAVFEYCRIYHALGGVLRKFTADTDAEGNDVSTDLDIFYPQYVP